MGSRDREMDWMFKITFAYIADVRPPWDTGNHVLEANSK